MYQADEKRYEEMKYNRCGASGLQLPAVSLGLWHNFGSNGNFDNMHKRRSGSESQHISSKQITFVFSAYCCFLRFSQNSILRI